MFTQPRHRKAQGCGGEDFGEKGECLHVEGELWDGVADSGADSASGAFCVQDS